MHVPHPEGAAENEGAAAPKPRQEQRADHISVGAGDDQVTRIQLAARWSELYAPDGDDSLTGALRRFRIVFDYVDAVTHGVEPPTLDSEEQTRAVAPAQPATIQEVAAPRPVGVVQEPRPDTPPGIIPPAPPISPAPPDWAPPR